MRNLLGRLNARSPAELTRIAQFWLVPVGNGPKHTLIGALYRTMTDPRAGRDAWERLGDTERELVQTLALGDESDTALTVEELAKRLTISTDEAHQVAAALWRAGIVAREGDDTPLPVGASPKLLMPREVALLFRRVRDEQDAGDLSTAPLGALLELLDDAELESAARRWGIRVIPGLRRRNDLIEQILLQVGEPQRLANVVTDISRRREAGALWLHVHQAIEQQATSQTNGTAPTVPLAESLAAAGLSMERPQDAVRTRVILAELENALLVWHAYAPSGERRLFIPSELVGSRVPSDRRPPLPDPVTLDPEPDRPWRHPDALAWDLLTILRAMSANDAPNVGRAGDFPRHWLRRVHPRLWIHGGDVPPDGYLDFLLTLAREEGLVTLTEPDDHGQRRFAVTDTTRAWRDLSFADQTHRLRMRWQSAPDGIESAEWDDVRVEGADWRGFRRKTLGYLHGLIPATDHETQSPWYPLDDLATWLAGRDADLLGATFSAASARQLERSGTGGDRRRAAIAEVVIAELTTVLRWFGIVELASVPRRGRVARVLRDGIADPLARAAAAAGPVTGEDQSAPAGPPLIVTLEGEIQLVQPTPLRVWSLLAFAEAGRPAEVTTFQLTEQALTRALAAGFDLQQVTSFLERQSGTSLPEPVLDDLTAWSRAFQRVRTRPALLISPDDPEQLAQIESRATALKLTTHRLDGRLVIELPPGDTLTTRHDEVLDALRAAGFHPAER